jgi:Molybdopterin-binding protein
MLTSSRNQFKGTVKSVKKGAVNDEIVIKLPGGTELTSIITETSTTTLDSKREQR